MCDERTPSKETIMPATRDDQPEQADHDHTDTHTGRSPRWRRRAVGLVGALAATFAVTGLSGVARADIVPCDPIDCPTGPVYAPEQVAIGIDRDFDDAAEEAEAQAAVTCVYDHTYDVVRRRSDQRPGGRWEHTLTYRCNSPLYDEWPGGN
jgi:hypothetical protein